MTLVKRHQSIQNWGTNMVTIKSNGTTTQQRNEVILMSKELWHNTKHPEVLVFFFASLYTSFAILGATIKFMLHVVYETILFHPYIFGTGVSCLPFTTFALHMIPMLVCITQNYSGQLRGKHAMCHWDATQSFVGHSMLWASLYSIMGHSMFKTSL